MAKSLKDLIVFQAAQVQHARPIAFDISVIHPAREGLLSESSIYPAAAAKLRFKEKLKKHEFNYNRIGYLFQPVVFEAYGGFEPSFDNFIKQFCQSRIHWPHGAENHAAPTPYALFKQSTSVFFREEHSRRVRLLYAKISAQL